MDYDMSYMPEGEKRFDLTIPVLLLILVFFVVAWKVGWLASIPGIGNIFGGTTSILIVGDDANIKNGLDTLATEKNINFNVLTQDEVDDIRNVDYLNNYDIVILTESLYSGDKKANLPSTFRKYLADYLEGGRKLILFRFAGSRVPDDANLNGWDTAGMGQFIPVYCPTANNVCSYDENTYTFTISEDSNTELKIYPDGAGHPIADGYTLTVSFASDTLTIDSTLVNTESGASKIIAIEENVEGEGSTSNPAIVEKSFGVGGKTIYFSYHPMQTPTLFKNTIKYLTGGQ